MRLKTHSFSFLKKISILIFPALLLYGCGVWADFTTYFNLYYNAADLFSQAEQKINEQKQDIFASKEPDLPQAANSLLVKVVEKCSKILQFHAESGYVDDALLMLGKCFYYQANYQKALRKFNELLTTQPKSELLLETNLWIGMTDMRLKDYDNGLAMLKKVREDAIKEGDNSISQTAFIEEIKYKLVQQDYPGAIDLSNSFLKISRNAQLNAKVALETGYLYNDLGDYKNSINSFQSVDKYAPTYDELVNSLVELGQAYRNTGQYAKSLDVYDKMKSEAKFTDNFAKIDLQRGITLYEMNRPEEAIKQLVEVDTGYSRTPSSGLADFELGKIFEKHYRLLDSASIYYSKVLSSMVPQDTILLARAKVDLFKKYNSLHEEYELNKKDIFYTLNPDQFTKDSIAVADTIKKQAEEEQAKSKEQELAATEKRGIRDFRTTEQARQQQQSKPVRLTPLIRPNTPVDTLKSRLAESEFNLGNLLFTELNIPDSAYIYYNDILTNYPDSPLRARTLFAMGSYYLTQNDSVKADSLFNIVYENYKKESIVNAAAAKLNKPLINFNYDPALPLYASAEKLLIAENYDSTLTGLKQIYSDHPKSPYAAKALYTTGWILENKLHLSDSAAVVYDTLTARYPKSVYASSVMPQLNFYKTEKARIAKMEADSLQMLAAGKDSVTSDSLKAVVKNEAAVKSDEKTKALEQAGKQSLDEQKPGEPKAGAREDEKLPGREYKANPDTLIRINPRAPRHRIR